MTADYEKKANVNTDESLLRFFGTAIKTLRKAKQWSLTTLAENVKSKMITSYISKIENGKQNTSLAMIDKILNSLDANIYKVIRSKVYIPNYKAEVSSENLSDENFTDIKAVIINKLNLLPCKELNLIDAIFENIIEYSRLRAASDDEGNANQKTTSGDKIELLNDNRYALKIAGKVKKFDNDPKPD